MNESRHVRFIVVNARQSWQEEGLIYLCHLLLRKVKYLVEVDRDDLIICEYKKFCNSAGDQ